MENLNINKLKGTGVALVTPFKDDKSIDFASLKVLVEHLINGGVNYLVVMGTTAESPCLNKDEKNAILHYVADINNKRLPIVYGIGGNYTNSVCESISEVDFTIVDAVLSVAPYYNKPQQSGIYEHYKMVSEASKGPIILYNVPSRTGVNISSETTLKLASQFKNIIGIKEASGNFSQFMEIIKNCPENFLVISGDDNFVFPHIVLGGHGVISVTANAFPKLFSNMVNFSLNNEIEKAKKLHYKLLNFSNIIFNEGSPSGIKYALSNLKILKNNLRLPLTPISSNLVELINLEISKLI